MVQTSDVVAATVPSVAVGIAYGCDYNPEQWPRETWAEDVRLMREAGVTLVAINIFGWAALEPRVGDYDFRALDEIVELLHAADVGINLGTGTSSPPPWLSRVHPEILPVAADGSTSWPGGRQAWCPSSPVFRSRALALVEQVARRYGDHPALRLWHVSNELGCHNALCYCDVSAAAFRVWLRARYGNIDALNTAWGTSFWSQSYTDWADILPPRQTLSAGNPSQGIDFARFSSDELLSYYLAEAAILRAASNAPVTTNFMVTAHIRTQNYWDWAPHVDIVANDHYLDHRLDNPHQELSFSADLTRGLAAGRPWLLMEQSTGAVNWQPRNIAKAPGEMTRNSVSHVARGADGVCFFQWRASSQGSEKFHSGMVPHAGVDTMVWREVLELGRILGAISEVAGSAVVADAAIVFSWEAWWAVDFESRPSADVRYLDQLHHTYRQLWEAGLTVDFVAPGADLAAYRLVIVPALYMVSDDAAATIERYVSSGGHALVTFFSGIVDEDDRVRLGGYPGAFRELLGVSTEEFHPLAPDEVVALDDGARATVWTERLRTRTATVISSYSTGTLAGVPAVTRNSYGSGAAWYVATQLDGDSLRQLLVRAASEAGVVPTRSSDNSGVEVVIRRSVDAEYLFVINHTAQAVVHPATGVELISGAAVEHAVQVAPGGVAVVRKPFDTMPPRASSRIR